MVDVIDGMDVSKFQGVIDYKTVGASGKMSFAFCKATDGNLAVDSQFKANWNGIKSIGLVRGAYHFAQPDMSMNDPIIEADHFVDTVGPLDPWDMLSLDIEKAGSVPAGPNFTNWVITFLERVEQRTGVRPIIYSGGPFFNQYGGVVTEDMMRRLTRFPFWLAAYVTHPENYIPNIWKHLGWIFWQRSGDVAAAGDTVLHVPGIGGGYVAVDHDIYRGTVSQLKDFAYSLHAVVEAPVPEPVPEPTPEPVPEPMPEPIPEPPSVPTTPPEEGMSPNTNIFSFIAQFLSQFFKFK